jgi:hypothetical protein
MSKELPEKLTRKIEAICEKGCFQVTQLLLRVYNGDDIEELAEFNEKETKLIIRELEQVMSVYTHCKPTRQ